MQTSAPQQAGNRARRHRQLFGDLAIGLARPSLFKHPIHYRLRCCMRTVMRTGGAIEQAIRPFLAETLEPFVGGAHADAGGMGRLFGA